MHATVETRVVVVSDTHLSPRTPEALTNWDAVVGHLAAEPPRFVVHAGDVTTDGAQQPGDLQFARTQLARVGARLHAVPGNHDIGDNPHAGHAGQASHAGHAGTGGHLGRNGHGPAHAPVTAERLARYRDALGGDQWTIDIPGWRLVGLNALLFDSGLDDEADQWHWLTWVLRGSRRVVLFLHKPLVPSPTIPDDANPGRYVPAAARARLMELLAPRPAAVVVSGHVHQFCHHHRFGIEHVWAPTTWAVLPDRIQPRHGDKVCGLVDLVLGADGSRQVRLRRPDRLAQNSLDVIANPYRPAAG